MRVFHKGDLQSGEPASGESVPPVEHDMIELKILQLQMMSAKQSIGEGVTNEERLFQGQAEGHRNGGWVFEMDKVVRDIQITHEETQGAQSARQ